MFQARLDNCFCKKVSVLASRYCQLRDLFALLSAPLLSTFSLVVTTTLLGFG